MLNPWIRAAIVVGTTACAATAAAAMVIALSGKPIRMSLTTSSGQVLVEINTEASVIPVYMDPNRQDVLIASSEVP